MVIQISGFLLSLPSRCLAFTINNFSFLIAFSLHTLPKICAFLPNYQRGSKFFILFDNTYSILNNSTTLSVFVVLVLSTFVAYYLQNDLQTVSATIAAAKDQLMPFDMKDMFGTGQAQNETANNSTNIVADDSQNAIMPCEMPPCPPGQACIQSCP